MCGIAGKVWADARRPGDGALVQAMCEAIVHRGPDDGGYVVRDNAAIGMRRLQVIDLEGGRQPIANEDGTVFTVFNGEIYNYRQLRRDLQDRGHRFKSLSDTEVIVHLYEEKGPGCVEDLRGMFAFAVWDTRQRTLLLARDRTGQKPLFYAQTRQGLAFASELGSLLSDRSIDRDLDPQAIDEYLSYLFVPHPRTIYRRVQKLPPATVALYRQGVLETRRYWGVRYQPQAYAGGMDAAVEELQALLEEAVDLRLLADVPLGAFLSGGLDSSLIVALMRKIQDAPVKSFAIGFGESSFNELDHARHVAEALGTEHREYVVDFAVEEVMGKLLRHFGEPFADSSAIPAYHLAKMTRQHVTVALSGDGGDEVFGGYRRYQARLLADAFGRPGLKPLFKAATKAAAALSEPATYYGSSLRKKFKRFVEFAAAVHENPRTSWAFFLPKRKKLLYIRQNLPIFSP